MKFCYADCHYAEHHYAQCHFFCMSLCCVYYFECHYGEFHGAVCYFQRHYAGYTQLNVVMLSVIMLSIILLSIGVLCGIIMSVPDECRYAECHYALCRGATFCYWNLNFISFLFLICGQTDGARPFVQLDILPTNKKWSQVKGWEAYWVQGVALGGIGSLVRLARFSFQALGEMSSRENVVAPQTKTMNAFSAELS